MVVENKTSEISSKPTTLFFVLTVCIVCWIRLLFFVKQHAVNLLFSDQWFYLEPLFNEGSWIDRFLFQHGPHYQGVGFIFSGWLLEVSQWNTNVDSYFTVVVLFFAAVTLLILKSRLLGTVQWSDCLYFLIVFSPLYYETMILSTNSSHSIVPFFFTMLFALSLTYPVSPIRITCSSLICFSLIFTGFGVFTGFFGALLIACEAIFAFIKKQKESFYYLIAIGILSFGATVFLHNYNFGVGEWNVETNTQKIFVYSQYVFYLLAGLFQLKGNVALGVGGLMFILLFVLFIFSIRGIYIHLGTSKYPYWATHFIFSTSVLFYAVSLAIVRSNLGIQYAASSRYMLMVLPFVISSFLIIQNFDNRRYSKLLIGFSLIIACRFCFLETGHKNTLISFQEQKRKWISSYSESASLAEINNRAGFNLVFASQNKLDYIRKHRLNFLAH